MTLACRVSVPVKVAYSDSANRRDPEIKVQLAEFSLTRCIILW